MARAPLMQLTEIALTFGGNPVFSNLDVIVQPGDRVALVGRNGSGKSTLMKVMAGLVEQDSGQRVVPPGTSVGYMEQDPSMAGFATLGDFAASALDPGNDWRVDMVAEGLDLDPARAVETASGGERRRAALAKILAEAPDLMLLDEPTNHLDIAAIAWLEAQLTASQAAFVLISHDRAFLTALTRATLWLDRGVVRRQEAGFAKFETWRDKVWADEDEARHKMDRKIKAEMKWAAEGISARRTRDMGRMRELQAMRAERAAMIQREGRADLQLETGRSSGKLVLEASGMSKSFGAREIVRGFSLRIQRGERVAFVGPNGTGKTTMIRLLLGQEAPDSGSLRLGANLDIAIFDQNRAALDPDATLWESLTGTEAMRLPGRGDQVLVRGHPRHVVSYLKDFLFDEAQARAPVRSLSGGETARLLLARIMAQPANVLVLDEPTNDLDIETLDLLTDLVASYDGTVLLVSHDRDFLDKVATTTVAMEGDGRAVVYAGGWSDYRAQRQAPNGTVPVKPAKGKAAPPVAKDTARATTVSKPGLTFTEQHRLKVLPDEIARLEAEIGKLEGLLADPNLYSRHPVKFAKATEALAERQTKLSSAEDEWLTLEEKAETG